MQKNISISLCISQCTKELKNNLMHLEVKFLNKYIYASWLSIEIFSAFFYFFTTKSRNKDMNVANASGAICLISLASSNFVIVFFSQS